MELRVRVGSKAPVPEPREEEAFLPGAVFESPTDEEPLSPEARAQPFPEAPCRGLGLRARSPTRSSKSSCQNADRKPGP